MPTERSVQTVGEIEEKFKASPLIIAANYRGLSVSQMSGMRRKVREANSEFKIAKNTLARIAADNAGRPEIKEFLEGPIGLLTTEGDPAAAAKVFVTYLDDNNIAMTIVGGALDGQVLTADRIKALAKLPTKEVLLAKLLGSMNSPITRMVMVMNGPLQAFATVLTRIVENNGVAAGATPEAESEPSAEVASGEPEAEAAPAVEAEPAEATAEAEEEKSE